MSTVYVVTLYQKDWKKSTCTCLSFFKTYMCKHVMSMAFMKGLTEIPPEANTGIMGPKPKRGRPSRSQKALLKQ